MPAGIPPPNFKPPKPPRKPCEVDFIRGRITEDHLEVLKEILRFPEVADSQDPAIVIESSKGKPLLRIDRICLQGLLDIKRNSRLFENETTSSDTEVGAPNRNSVIVVLPPAYPSLGTVAPGVSHASNSGSAVHLPVTYKDTIPPSESTAYAQSVLHVAYQDFTGILNRMTPEHRDSIIRQQRQHWDNMKRHVEAERRNLLKMPLDKKRQLYACGNNFVPIGSIPSWDDECPNVKTKDEYLQKILANPMELPKDYNLLRSHTGNARLSKNTAMNSKVSIFEGEITTLEVDAIVCPSGLSLDAHDLDITSEKIFQYAGDVMKTELRMLIWDEKQPLSPHRIQVTLGYKLPAKNVIHAAKLCSTDREYLMCVYKKILDTSRSKGLKTIAFPEIDDFANSVHLQKILIELAICAVQEWLKAPDNANSVQRKPKRISTANTVLSFRSTELFSASGNGSFATSTGKYYPNIFPCSRYQNEPRNHYVNLLILAFG